MYVHVQGYSHNYVLCAALLIFLFTVLSSFFLAHEFTHLFMHMYIVSSIFFCVLLCIGSSWASLGQSRMNSLLSETMNEPSVAKRPDFQLQSVPNGRQLNPFNKAIRPSRFDPGQLERPSLSFDQAAIRPRQFDVMADPLTPSVAEVRSAINEVKALNQKEAQVNRELFEQSE